MTVRAQDSQILQTVIIGNAVDVIQFQRYRFAHPLSQPAILALALLESGAKQTPPKVSRTVCRTNRQDLLKRTLILEVDA